jgi:hypothetical protein
MDDVFQVKHPFFSFTVNFDFKLGEMKNWKMEKNNNKYVLISGKKALDAKLQPPACMREKNINSESSLKTRPALANLASLPDSRRPGPDSSLQRLKGTD